MTTNDTSDRDLLFQKLNQETGKINWIELQKYFAKGVLIVVARELDLIKIAEQISEDQNKVIAPYLNSGKIYRAADEDAIRWNERNQSFWAVVVAPWVLVQEI